MVKTKNGIKQIVALILIVALAVASLLLAIPKNSKSVYAAPPTTGTGEVKAQVGKVILYESGTLFESGSLSFGVKTVKKTKEQLIADGDISITDGQLKILNKNLVGGLYVDIVKNSLDGLFEGCVGLTDIFLLTQNTNDWNRTFYGCTGLKNLQITVSEMAIPFNTATDVFEGCRNLGMIGITISYGTMNFTDCSKTFADLGLNFTSYSSSDGTTYSSTDKIPEDTTIILSGYQGSTTPSTPSTGIATDMLGLVVTAVIVLAICYVASKKKKAQR